MVSRVNIVGYDCGVEYDPDGYYVKYADYAALKAENERLERERDKWEQRACTGDDVLARTRDKLSAAERAVMEAGRHD